MSDHPTAIQRMTVQIRAWEEVGDARATFLSCYALMTGNMLAALEAGQFHDGAWVRRLLEHFADYYFRALADYDADPAAAPAVWRCAHDAACEGRVAAIQNLLLGVNAHINYDLVLATADLLTAEWHALPPATRQQRQEDYNRVNDIISHTIDAVQDTILERREPALDVLDRLLGPVDEWLISREITRWRTAVWMFAIERVEMVDAEQREQQRQAVEETTLRLTRLFGG